MLRQLGLDNSSERQVAADTTIGQTGEFRSPTTGKSRSTGLSGECTRTIGTSNPDQRLRFSSRPRGAAAARIAPARLRAVTDIIDIRASLADARQRSPSKSATHARCQMR